MIIPNPDVKISRHFTWHEALYLPKLHRLADEEDGITQQVLDNLLFLFGKMDIVRDFIALPINVHCAYRPKIYNDLIGGAPGSAHMALDPGVAAVDFDVTGMDCNLTRGMLADDLEQWEMRMEDNGPAAPWIHLDTRPLIPGHSRFFKP